MRMTRNTGQKKTLDEEVKTLVEQFMHERGLELSSTKDRSLRT